MASEELKGVKEKLEEEVGSLRSCLVEGDAQERHVQSKRRQRALAISVALQGMALTLLLLAPLFGKAERIQVKDWVPLPPFRPVGHATTQGRKPITDKRPPWRIGFNFTKPLQPIRSTSEEPNSSEEADNSVINSGGRANTIGCNLCEVPGGSGKGPEAPMVESKAAPHRVQITHIDPAMLKHRVEPVYPVLAKQTHHSGKVELRAIIGTDGRIRSLGVVVSDPLLNQSALDAVGQWVYKPTLLNGQAVEVDTYIAVIYTSQP